MVGPGGIVEGTTRSFTTLDTIPFEDFETYAGTQPLVWSGTPTWFLEKRLTPTVSIP